MWPELSTNRSRLAALAISIMTGVLAVAAIGIRWQLAGYLVFATITGPLAVIDWKSKRLPNSLTLPAVPVIAGLFLIPAMVDQLWMAWRGAIIGGLVLTVIFGVLYLIYPSGLGMGDVKLAMSMGLVLGWISVSTAIFGLALSFITSAVVALALLAARKATLKTQLPFGPFMLTATWLTIFLRMKS